MLYNKKRVYKLKRYKDFIEKLIQISYRKVDLKKTLYQIICKKIKEEIKLYCILY